MTPRSSPDPGGTDEAGWPDEDWDEAGETDGFYQARPGGALPWPDLPARYGGGPNEPPRPGARRWSVLAAVAVAAAAVGAGVVVGINGAFSSAGTSPAPGNSSMAPAPGAGSGNGYLPPGAAGGGGGGGGGEQMLAAGKVTAVSGTSITVSGNGNTITAAITSATDFTGSVKSARGIKVGDLVMLDVSVNGGSDTAASIQDPFGGGSMP